MNNELSALDTSEYRAWIGELKKRYRATQIKAAVAVNSALIEYYWNLGKDISEKYPGRVRDAEFYKRLSIDLKSAISGATGLSVSNIKYARYFFELYSGERYRQQLADDKELTAYRPQVVDDKMDSHHYLIVEVKTGKFEPADLGQLLGYKVMVKHALNTPEDHEPIGLLICRDHNRILAQYMMDELKTPLGITDYELHRILPPVEKIRAALEEGGSKNA